MVLGLVHAVVLSSIKVIVNILIAQRAVLIRRQEKETKALYISIRLIEGVRYVDTTSIQ
jgi:hypothetical protein